MRILVSLNWLKELVEVTLPPEELAELLTIAGFEVEGIDDRRTWADGVVVGEVVTCEPHPNADKLRVCQVNIGAEHPSTIVCGAANVQAGMRVAVATLGTYLPKVDLKIRPAKLRGVASEGMICSLAELGLEKESNGIYSFADAPTIGSDVRPLLGLDDVILEVTSTANRADALSMVGIAREVAALTGAKLSLPQVSTQSLTEPLAEAGQLEIHIEDPRACPVYIGTIVEQVKIGPSPAWLRQRLLGAGVRPINNVVDVTNYVLLEWGQPLHAFDRDRLRAVSGLSDLKIGVRHATAGESFKTLDGQVRSLKSQNLLITANDRPVALAGVMGGEETEVYEGTQALLLEAAVFDPVAVRRSARSQGLMTEASIRYERGVNRAELSLACDRALQLITELASGVPLVQAVASSAVSDQNWTRTLTLRLDRVRQVLGEVVDGEDNVKSLDADDVKKTLTALGCLLEETEPAQTWRVTVPPYRHRDLEREIDLIEEVARLYGYDRFIDTLPAKTEPGYLSWEQSWQRLLRQVLQGAGLTEVMHYSLVKAEGERQVVLSNPLLTEYSALRTELLAGLLDAYQYNWDQGNGSLNAYEIGRVFWQEEGGLYEADRLAGVLGGDPATGRWVRSGREQPMTWYEAKGVLESVLQRLGLVAEYQPDRRDDRLHPGRTASLWLQGNRLGTFGQVHPQIQMARNLSHPIYLFELDLDVLLDHLDQAALVRETEAEDSERAIASPVPRFRPYSTYPASSRDLALFAALDLSVADLIRTMSQAGGELLASAEVFDEYRGESVPEGQRSLAFRLTYRASDRTLTDEEVETAHQKVREALLDKFSVDLRS